MHRETAYALLGTRDRNLVSRLCGLSLSCVDHWPEWLPRRSSDAVVAAAVRLEWTEGVRRRPAIKDRLPPHIVEILADVSDEYVPVAPTGPFVPEVESASA